MIPLTLTPAMRVDLLHRERERLAGEYAHAVRIMATQAAHGLAVALRNVTHEIMRREVGANHGQA
jgi:hypothetical protein